MAVGDITWKVNGVDLDTALGAVLSDVTVWRPPVSVRRNTTTIPGRHGVLPSGLPVLDEPTITIRPRWNVASQADLEEKVNHAQALFTQPSLTLTRVSGPLTATATAELVSLTQGDFIVGAGASVTAMFAVPGVFFRTAAATSTDFVFSADLTNQEVATLSGSTGPVTDAVIRVTGPCTSVSVTDPTTGTGLSWSGTLAAGQYLFLCPSPLTARISADPAAFTVGGTSVLSGVDWPATGRLQLWPVVQTATTRRVLLSATGTGRSAATRLTVRGQGSYL